jgi:hypothetical protein
VDSVTNFQKVRADAVSLGWSTVVADCDIALAHLGVGIKRPVVGNSQMHHQENWMADWIDQSLVADRAVPWTLGADLPNGLLARSRNGVAPTRSQAWPIYGAPTELYSQFPYLDPQGRSHPYNPETSDDIDVIDRDFMVRPPKVGPRGVCMPISQGTIIPHPTIFPPADATMNKSPNTGFIPRTPLAIFVRHDGLIQFWYADGRVINVGWIPGIARSHDVCIDGRFMTSNVARKTLYVCDLGTKNAQGVWSGGRIAKVDRMPGAVVANVSPEDPSKYVTTTLVAAGYPTAVRSDEQGNVYFIDMDKAGEITVVPPGGSPTPLVTVPNAFALDYANGKLYVACSTGNVHIVDIATKTVGPDLMPTTDSQNHTAPSSRGADFFTISVDANGTCGPVGQFMVSRVHTHGNTNSWRFGPGGTPVLYGNAILGSGQGWNTYGDVNRVHELFGHYDWEGGKYHMDQAVQFVGGFANCPVGVIVHNADIGKNPDGTYIPAPAQYAPDYTAIWRGMRNIVYGGPVVNLTRPSLTCLMTREGWSPFKGCSNDEIAEMSSFDAIEAFIQGGYIGSFPRPDIVGNDLYCLMLFHLVNSQRHIREGAALINNFRSWWTGKGRTFPPNPAATVDPYWGRPKVTTHMDGNAIDYRLEVREVTPGNYRIGIFGSSSADIRYGVGGAGNEQPASGIPSDAVIVVDEGMPNQQIGTAGLTSGWHAFTVRANGWCTGAVTYLVP